ncbi:hypothetical protein A3K82_02225 [Candidatus Pacearchaeota archaeon RBG_19FT_COMBO_34_9]|nr:MAG: hypothetical protein A3K82_02225 [Candidatus Pacearchaeota archaeon RBG_19FT_COMBO_34_9]OGJ16098.1 MAG: hypothetical protein A3K74_02605 [Candidatus Pacearchaeota archaeon RBG_13_33_26]
MAFLGTAVGIIALACAVWVIYDVLVKNKRLKTTTKVIWIVCAVFFSIITAIIYFLIGRKK